MCVYIYIYYIYTSERQRSTNIAAASVVATWRAPHSHSSTPYHPSTSCAVRGFDYSGSNALRLYMHHIVTLQTMYICILACVYVFFLLVGLYVGEIVHYSALYCTTLHYIPVHYVRFYYCIIIMYIYVYIYIIICMYIYICSPCSFSEIDMCIHSFIDLAFGVYGIFTCIHVHRCIHIYTHLYVLVSSLLWTLSHKRQESECTLPGSFRVPNSLGPSIGQRT